MPTRHSSPEQHPSPAHEELHLLLLEMRDEQQRFRVREAFYISILLHIALAMAIVFSPNWLPDTGMIAVLTPAEQLQAEQRELRYLELPPDLVTPPPSRRPETNVMSDRDRLAQSRNPSVDRALQELMDSNQRRPGPPGQQASRQPAPRPAPQPAPQPQGQPAQQPGQQVAQQQQQTMPPIPPPQQPPQNQLARLEPPAGGAEGVFGGGLSASSAMEQAARATAGGGRSPGFAGEWGGGARPRTSVAGNIDVLSDTMGVDFAPYLSRVLHTVRENWYILIPEVARAPLMKKGKVTVEFAIMKDGRVAGLAVVSDSGDVSLDRAALGGIRGSNPFQPLPGEFRGDHIRLRFHFHYNPDRNELR